MQTGDDAAVGKVIEQAFFIKKDLFCNSLNPNWQFTVGRNTKAAARQAWNALLMGIIVKEVKPEDEVIVLDFTFIATGKIVSLNDAVTVFMDVKDDTLNIDPEKMEE